VSRAAYRAVVLAVFVLLAGCGQTHVPQDHYYRLRLPAPVRLEAPVLHGTLVVKRLGADGLLQGRSIVHSRASAPLEAEAYHYHHWTDIPPVMLQQQLVAYLRAAGIASRVAGANADIRPDYLVTGRIRRFERLVDGSVAGVIELELALIRAASGRMLYSHVYHRETRASGRAMLDTVAALNSGLAEIYGDFLHDLVRKDGG